jgi:hypothetical protein
MSIQHLTGVAGGLMEYEIQKFDRPRSASVACDARLFRWVSTFSFAVKTDQPLVHHGSPRGPSPVAKPLMAEMVQQQMGEA